MSSGWRYARAFEPSEENDVLVRLRCMACGCYFELDDFEGNQVPRCRAQLTVLCERNGVARELDPVFQSDLDAEYP